jgi:predicted DNA-binding transcriptional regulator AlpA
MPEIDPLLRIWQIVGCRRRGVPGLIPISRSGFYAGVKDGRFPPGMLIGPRTRVWRMSLIAELIASFNVAAR